MFKRGNLRDQLARKSGTTSGSSGGGGLNPDAGLNRLVEAEKARQRDMEQTKNNATRPTKPGAKGNAGAGPANPPTRSAGKSTTQQGLR